MKVLDLFSGIGGFSLGLERAGMETIAFCEIEEYPRKVLAKHWPEVPIARDVTKLTYQDGVLYDDGEEIYRGTIELICGGYPCQPFSLAGKRRGKEDDRHLWPEYLRLIREIRPRWIIGENVAGHINMGLDEVLSDLESEGYTPESFIIPACAINAPHRRDRIWVVAHSNSELSKVGRHDQSNEKKSGFRRDKQGRSGGNDRRQFNTQTYEDVAYPNSQGMEGREKPGDAGEVRQGLYEQLKRCVNNYEWGEWKAEPQLGRVANGIPDRAHRLKCLGNAVVPQIPEILGRAIMANNTGEER